MLDPSYGDRKFIAVLTDEATKVTSFAPMSSKSTDDLAAACFVEWICKMSVPQVIDTNLSEDQSEALKDKLDLALNQDIPHNPFIDANRGSCFNQKAADSINKMVNTAELSWEDFLPALNFAHNTSYQSSIAFLNPIGALMSPLIGAGAESPQVKETTRVEREAAIKYAETFRIPTPRELWRRPTSWISTNAFRPSLTKWVCTPTRL